MMAVDEVDPRTPSYVPRELVVDGFDIFNLEVPDADPPLVWHKVKLAHPPIFWTNENGGHWVATDAADIKAIQLDHVRFSMAQHNIPKNRRGMRAPPIDLDPPQHFGYRALISPAFSPKALAALESSIQQVLDDLLDRVAPKGECEFVEDVAHVLPITVFLRMMGLPEEDAGYLLPLSTLNTQAKELEVSQRTRAQMAEYLKDKIEARKAHPTDDVLSQVVHGKVDGQPVPEDALLGMCTLLLAGGLDTVASMMGFIFRFLATHPAHLAELAANPALIPQATEEFFRRCGIANTARILVEDCEFHGVALKAGDLIQIPNCLYGLDASVVDNPLEVDFHRKAPIPYASFGNGPHSCPGKALARLEVRLLLRSWLSRIPEFTIKPGTTPRARIGMTNSMRELWLCWG